MMRKAVTSVLVLATMLSGTVVARHGIALEAQAGPSADQLKTVALSDGTVLHYAERGHGVPVVFVHGSLADYGAWTKELASFSTQFRAVAYSRRYNWPNTNAIRSGHSAVQDADDLAAFIKALGLGPVHVVGHSYGAFTTLFLATRHPGLVRSIVLAEPPAVSLLAGLPADQSKAGRATLDDIQTRVKEMQKAWRAGDREEGMRVFFTWQTGNPQFWDRVLPEEARQASRRNYQEWDAVLVSGRLFPSISSQAIGKITVPSLVISGADTTPYLATIAAEVTRLLQPQGGTHVVIPKAGHVMFAQQPSATVKAVFDFLAKVSSPAPAR